MKKKIVNNSVLGSKYFLLLFLGMIILTTIISVGIFAEGPGGSTMTRTVTPLFGPPSQIFTVKLTATRGNETMAGIIEEVKPSSFEFYNETDWISTFDFFGKTIDGDSLDIAFTESSASGYYEYKLQAGSSSGELSGGVTWDNDTSDDLGTITLIVCVDDDKDSYSVTGGLCGDIDCDDNDSSINPGAKEIPKNGIDENCDGFDLSFMIVNSPQPAYYEDKKVIFNISLLGEADYLQCLDLNDARPKNKTLCKDCNGYGLDKKKTKNLVDGEHNLIFYAIKDDKIYEENISLFIDSKKPIIHKVEPRQNSVINGSEFLIKYTEGNLQNIILFWNPNKTLENCSAGKAQECRTEADLSSYDGKWIDYWFEISDVINKVESKKTRVFVDTTSPVLTVNMPENKIGNETYGRKVPFNVTVSEDVLLEYYDSEENTPRWRTLCTRCDEYGDSKTKTKSFKKGSHKLLIKAVDKAGNSDAKEVNFEISY